jgi:hyperosmotically inducible protein
VVLLTFDLKQRGDSGNPGYRAERPGPRLGEGGGPVYGGAQTASLIRNKIKNGCQEIPGQSHQEVFVLNQVGKYLSALFVAVALITAAGCESTPKQESAGEYIDDSVITGKVKAAILDDPSLKVAEINVETFKGVVQLSGFVNSQADINRAVEIARSVRGVTSVKNDMRLK